MSVIKDGRLPITLDKERHLLFSLNVMDEVQDRIGGLEKLGDAITGVNSTKNIKWLMTLLLNEGADESEPALTEGQVGKMIHMGNMLEVITSINMVITLGNTGSTEPEDADPDDYDDDEDGEKNVTAGGV